MRAKIAKDIATALIARSSQYFDSFAFDEADISENDKQKIGNEIIRQCEKMTTKIENRYNVRMPYTTGEIIKAINQQEDKL